MAETFKAPRLDVIDAQAIEALVFDQAHATRVENANRLIHSREDVKRFEAFAQSSGPDNRAATKMLFRTNDGRELQGKALLNHLSSVFFKVFEVVAWLGIAGSILVLFLAITGAIPH